MTLPTPMQGGTTRPSVATTPIADVARVGDRGVRTRRLIAYALLMIVPFAWSVSTSFKTNSDAVRQLTFMPNPVSLEGWQTAFNELDPALPRLFLNSTLIAGAVTLSNVVLGSMAGYAFARLRFPGRELLFIMVLGTMMIPDQLRLVPIYQILRTLGLLQDQKQFLGMILVLAISAGSIFLRNCFWSWSRPSVLRIW